MKGGTYMERLETPYGILEGATDLTYYKSGKLRSCKLEVYNQIATTIGIMVPQHGEINTRTKWRETLSFYETGELKSIYLKAPTEVNTTVGRVKAEFITFYKEGTIHRLFPLYGQVSGYWSEDEEYQLAEKVTFKVGNLQVDNKINSYCFYPSGQLKSLSLWKKEILMAQFNKKAIAIRLGVAFYENGHIKSLEPYIPTMVKTLIGDIMAYSNEPIGIHGDTNSLVLDELGKIKSVMTVSTAVQIKNHLGEEKVITPHLVRSQLDLEKWIIAPIRISFTEKQVIIIDEKTTHLFDRDDIKWTTIQTYFEEISPPCMDCQGCQGCQGCPSRS